MDGILGKTPLPNRVTARKSLIAVIFSTHHFHEPKVQRLCNGLVFRRPSNLIPAGNFYVKPIVSRSVCMAAIVSSSEIFSHWENGDFSVVQAWNKGQAAERLDEVANAEGLPLHVLSDFLVHFKLTDEGEIELEEFGEEFEHLLD
jgi:hypothetical protein